MTLEQKSVLCEEVGKKGSVIPGKENTLIKDLGIAVIPVILGLHGKGDHGVKTFSKTTTKNNKQVFVYKAFQAGAVASLVDQAGVGWVDEDRHQGLIWRITRKRNDGQCFCSFNSKL